MNQLLGNVVDYVTVYIDDILITQKEDKLDEFHLEKLATVLEWLKNHGCKATNLKKSFFMQEEIEYIEHLLTRSGIKPQPRQVEALPRMQPSKNWRQIKWLLEMEINYRDNDLQLDAVIFTGWTAHHSNLLHKKARIPTEELYSWRKRATKYSERIESLRESPQRNENYSLHWPFQPTVCKICFAENGTMETNCGKVCTKWTQTHCRRRRQCCCRFLIKMTRDRTLGFWSN